MHKSFACLTLLLGLAISPLTASASIHTDLAFTELKVAFDSNSRELHVTENSPSGQIDEFDYGVRNIDFDLLITLDSTGNAEPGVHSYSLNGKVKDADGETVVPNGLLLHGTLESFRFEHIFDDDDNLIPTLGNLVFVLTVADDSLLLEYFGSRVEMKLGFTTVDGVTWTFDSASEDYFGGFTGIARSSADLYSAPVPEPGSMAIWAVIGATAFVAGRRGLRA